MSNKEEHTIKKLIQSIDLDIPSANFADKVMSKVNVISNNETLKDIVLVSLLKKNSLETPNADFSAKIMAKVNTNNVVDYKPIISNKGWSIIFLFFASFITYVLFSKPTITYKNKYISEFSIYFNDLIIDLSNSITQNLQVPSILIVSVLCLSVLLLLDAAIRSKRVFY